jgi:hypothetical protein
MTKGKGSSSQPKERGCWLTGWLIFIAIHGIGSSILILSLRWQETMTVFAWALPVLFLLSLADIVAAVAVWSWKRWGLVLYAISTLVGLVAGLVLTRTQLWVFHDIIPLVVLGYLVKDKRDLFD